MEVTISLRMDFSHQQEDECSIFCNNFFASKLYYHVKTFLRLQPVKGFF